MNHTCNKPARLIVAIAVSSILAFGCAAESTDSQEIVDNLLQAGFPADDIMVVDNAVYVGMARAPSTGCSFTINAVIDPSMNGVRAGFPSGGVPYSSIIIGGQLSQYGVDTIEHVITHEIGHTIGFRHSDYYNRSISCGTGGNKGEAGVGAIHIPGTSTNAVVGGSIMNSCFRPSETGEMTGGDVTALLAMYRKDLLTLQHWGVQQGGFWDAQKWVVGDFNGDGQDDLAKAFDDAGLASIDVHLN